MSKVDRTSLRYSQAASSTSCVLSGLGVPARTLAQDPVVHLDEVEQASAPGGGAPSDVGFGFGVAAAYGTIAGMAVVFFIALIGGEAQAPPASRR